MKLGLSFEKKIDICHPRKQVTHLIHWPRFKKQVFIPKGFAHGYICITKRAIVSYKVDNYYNKGSEVTIVHDDPHLGIDWQIPSEKITILEKEKNIIVFSQVSHFDFKKSLYD